MDKTEEPGTSEDKIETTEEADKKDKTEESTDETEATTETTEEEIKYPAMSFNRSAGGMNVSISAPEGALPEGASVKVVGVSASRIEDAVQDLYDENTKVVKAVDITFYDKDGKEIEPKKVLSVKFTSSAFDDLEEAKVVHIKDNGVAERVSGSNVDTDNKKATFETKNFSVYAVVETVVPRLTVIFKNGDTKIAEMYVKEADSAAEVEKIIYDPGAGSLASDEVFRGWTTDEVYTNESTKFSIAQVRSDAMDKVNALTTDESITYYAAIYKQYNITYIDGDITLGSETAETPRHADPAEASYTVNMGYTVDDSHNFEGWLVADGGSNIAGHVDDTLYPNGTEITVTGNVKFSVSAPEGHWLVFDENGKGATYNAPQFIKAGENTAEPSLEMRRQGYYFAGWYTGAPSKIGGDPTGEEFEFGHPITETTTIYAKWTAETQGKYTVLIWKQNVKGDDYDFVEAIPLTGNVGSTINTVSAHGNGNNRYARINGTNYNNYTGFHLKEFSENVEIVPEGTAVVNVYYDRNQHTLKFQVNGYVEVPNTYNEGTQYRKRQLNPGYAEIYYNSDDGKWYRDYSSRFGYSNEYTGTRYKYYNSWETIKEITALYGQSIGDQFPIVGTDGVTFTAGRWDPQSNTPYSEVLSYIDIMPDADVTFHRDTGGPGEGNYKNIYYYIEALPGDTNTVSFKDKEFKLYKQLECNYSFFTEAEDYIELVGFDKYGVDPATDAWGSGGASTVKCYYTRKNYSINFMDGVYFDGNGNPTDQASRGQLKEIENVEYGLDLSSYNKDGSDYFEPTFPGYKFEGWYLDTQTSHTEIGDRTLKIQ